ncbi:long-chain fatty acid--CoA ligase [Salinibaculum rarum]|uniref:long-chain fatty acid--CoA ligase n=1 Tax=Salinibaculum rarum TaxID=3058903 RepID=UPI00265FF0EE|nr:long-chain fatty acid--CoA ligase [Salinibaculum sp. KK48]
MPGGTPQTLRPFLWRAANLYPDTEIVSRTHEGMTRTTYAEYADQVGRLANALDEAGIDDGDRVATVCWNHDRHFETYFAAPSTGAQLHTVNPLLPDEHLQYIVEDAQDRIIFVDPSLAEKVAGAYDEDAFESVEQFVVIGSEVPDVGLPNAVAYDDFVGGQDTEYDWPQLSGETPAGMCYTSGTTGKPKGVEYTQQMLWSHTMAELTPMGMNIADTDVVMPVVPMFHVNAWGMPYATAAAGAKHVYPGPSPDPEDLAHLIEEEGVTITAGVPTVWLGLLEYLEDNEVDLSTLDEIYIGGAAAPESVIRAYDDLGVTVVHAWGMTETSPIGSTATLKGTLEDADYETQLDKRGKQGLVLPGLEFKVVRDDGERIEWDGEDFGELLIRGPWVTTEYHQRPAANEQDFEDDWLRTGDIVTVDEDGYMDIVDRADDVIKSGGEWISTQELENTMMGHDAVSEAAVIGVPHERYQERPVGFVVRREGTELSDDDLEGELSALLDAEFPSFWKPEKYVFIDEVPKTATGKFSKKDLREEYADESLLSE